MLSLAFTTRGISRNGSSNVLIAAHRREHPLHQKALRRLIEVAEGSSPWALPILVIPEFLRVVTHPSIFTPPSPLEVGLKFIDELLASPQIRLLFPGSQFWEHLREIVLSGDARGNLVFDAQIAALCAERGALNLLTGDRDFARFPQIHPQFL